MIWYNREKCKNKYKVEGGMPIVNTNNVNPGAQNNQHNQALLSVYIGCYNNIYYVKLGALSQETDVLKEFKSHNQNQILNRRSHLIGLIINQLYGQQPIIQQTFVTPNPGQVIRVTHNHEISSYVNYSQTQLTNLVDSLNNNIRYPYCNTYYSILSLNYGQPNQNSLHDAGRVISSFEGYFHSIMKEQNNIRQLYVLPIQIQINGNQNILINGILIIYDGFVNVGDRGLADIDQPNRNIVNGDGYYYNNENYIYCRYCLIKKSNIQIQNAVVINQYQYLNNATIAAQNILELLRSGYAYFDVLNQLNIIKLGNSIIGIYNGQNNLGLHQITPQQIIPVQFDITNDYIILNYGNIINSIDMYNTMSNYFDNLNIFFNRGYLELYTDKSCWATDNHENSNVRATEHLRDTLKNWNYRNLLGGNSNIKNDFLINDMDSFKKHLMNILNNIIKSKNIQLLYYYYLHPGNLINSLEKVISPLDYKKCCEYIKKEIELKINCYSNMGNNIVNLILNAKTYEFCDNMLIFYRDINILRNKRQIGILNVSKDNYQIDFKINIFDDDILKRLTEKILYNNFINKIDDNSYDIYDEIFQKYPNIFNMLNEKYIHQLNILTRLNNFIFNALSNNEYIIEYEYVVKEEKILLDKLEMKLISMIK